MPAVLVAAEEKVGAMASMTRALVPARELLLARAGSVRVAVLPAAWPRHFLCHSIIHLIFNPSFHFAIDVLRKDPTGVGWAVLLGDILL